MKRSWIWRRLGETLLPVAMLLAGILWLRPYGLSTYHLEVGGSLLENALVTVYPDRLAPEQVVDGAGLRAAITHLEEAIRLDPRNVQAMRLLARAYLSLGQPEVARQILQKALAVRPGNPLLRLELADIYDSLGYTEDALLEYTAGGIGSRVIPLVANYLKMADAQIERGSGDVAIHLWYKTLALDPGNLYALYRLYRIHRDLGDAERAAFYGAQLSSLQQVAVPLDFRLAEYQTRAMIALVEEGIWPREKWLGVLSNQIHQAANSGLLPNLMARRILEVLLDRWPEDPDLESLYQTLSE